MKLIMFSIYYVKLQVGVASGTYYTASPMSIAWRWRHWNRRYNVNRPF